MDVKCDYFPELFDFCRLAYHKAIVIAVHTKESMETSQSQASQESVGCLDTSRCQDDGSGDMPPHKVARAGNVIEAPPLASKDVHSPWRNQSQFEEGHESSPTPSQCEERERVYGGVGQTSSSSQTVEKSSPAKNKATKRKRNTAAPQQQKDKEKEKDKNEKKKKEPPEHLTWNFKGSASEFNLKAQTDFREQTIFQHGHCHIRAVVKKLTQDLKIGPNTTTYDIFKKLLGSTLEDLAGYTRSCARRCGDSDIATWKIYPWLAQELYVGQTTLSPKPARMHLRVIISRLWRLNPDECMLGADEIGLVKRNLCPYDREAMHDEIGITTLAEPWVNRAFTESCRIFTTNYGQYSLDNEMLGTQSKEVSLSSVNPSKRRRQSAHQLVDVFTNIIVWARHRKREIGQDAGLLSMIDEWVKCAGPSIKKGATLTFDRVYCKANLWKKLSAKGIGFTGICTPDSLVGHPFVGKASNKSRHYNPDGYVSDDERMGDGIFAATKKYALDDGSAIEVYAHAIRRANQKADVSPRKVTQIIRMVSSSTPVPGEELSKTFVWERKKLPTALTEARSLFYNSGRVLGLPATTRNRTRVEAQLRGLGVVPLTMGQRCADWFVLRRFILTGTTAAQLATHGSDACKLVSKRKQTRLADTAAFAKMCKSWFLRCATESMHEGTLNEIPVMSALRSQGYIQHVYDIGLIRNSASELFGVSCDGIALFDPEASQQIGASHSDQGQVFWSDSDEGDSDESNDDFDDSLDDDIDFSLAADWDAATDGSQYGERDAEDSSYSAAHLEHNVERDNVTGQSTQSALASIKITTDNSRIAASSAIARMYGTFFRCDVGSKEWWSVVPAASHRGQLLHQAMVTGLEHALYVMASTEGRILYVVDVRISQVHKEEYRTSLLQYEHLLKWRFSANAIPPVDSTSKWARVALSHSALWLAVCKHVRLHGPMIPILQFKSAVQDTYNALKHGIHGMSQLLIPTYNPLQTYTFRQKLVADTLRQVAINACSIRRLMKATTHEWQGMATFRKRCNQYGYPDLMMELIQQLFMAVPQHRRAQRARPASFMAVPQHRRVQPARPVQAAAAHVRVPKRNRKKWFYENPAGRQLRLSAEGHFPEKAPQRACLMCGRRITQCCVKCGVSLCQKKDNNCFRAFHTE